MAQIKCSNEELSGLDLSQCQDRTPKRKYQGRLSTERDQESIIVTYSIQPISLRHGYQIDALKALAWSLSNDLNLIAELINTLENESTNQG